MKRIFLIVSSVILSVSFAPFDGLAAEIETEEVIVFFNDRESMNKTILTNSLGNIEKKYVNLPAMVMEVPVDKIDDLERIDTINLVETNLETKINVIESSLKEVEIEPKVLDWGIGHIGADDSWAAGYKGDNIKVAVADTGIFPHSDLKIVGGASFVPDTNNYGVAVSDTIDYHGHGTHVAGIIAALDNGLGTTGVAPMVDLYSLKVFNSSGTGTTSTVLSAIDWALSNDMDILNLSLGSQRGFESYRLAFEEAKNKGLIVVAASGNDHEEAENNGVDYPAIYPSTIAVGAIDKFNKIASFSSRGPAVDVVAPGVNVLSTYLNNQHASMSGTSMATPYVAGIMALFKEANPTFTNNELQQAMVQETIDLGVEGKDDTFGYGYIQAPTGPYNGKVPLNNPPLVIGNGIEDLTIEENDFKIIDLQNYFTDFEGDYIFYSAISSTEAAQVTTTNNRYLRIDALSEGDTYVTVNARDASSSTSNTFKVKVEMLNQSPIVIKPMDDLQIEIGESKNIDLTTIFSDINGDIIYFSNELLGTSATVNLVGSNMTVIGSNVGETNVKISVTDGKFIISEEFMVSVKKPILIEPFENFISFFETSKLYNNPDEGGATISNISPQTVYALNKMGNWYEVKTWLGNKWIKPTYFIEGRPTDSTKRIKLNERSYLHNTPNAETIIPESLSPQYVYSIREWNGWYLIKTWVGYKWIRPVNAEVQPYIEKVTLKERYNLHTNPDDYYVTNDALSAQTVYAYEKRGSWYKVQTWLGYRWIKPINYVIEKPSIQNNYITTTLRNQLYELPFGNKTGSSTVSPQKLYVHEKIGNWYLIQTWLGKKWIQI